MFEWKIGRQNSGYQKMLLFKSKWPIPFDLYVLRYSKNSYVPLHKDPVLGGKHHRLNVVLKYAKEGGKFVGCKKTFQWWRITLFRPDKVLHRVTRIQSGTRYVLSLGWIT